MRDLRNTHWMFLGVASILFGAYVLFAERILEWARGVWWLDQNVVAETQPLLALPAGVALAVTVGLMGVAVFGWRLHARHHAAAAAVVTALWMIGVSTVGWNQYAQQPAPRVEQLASAARAVVESAGDRPLFVLHIDPQEQALNEEFRLYTNRLIRSLSPAEFRERATSPPQPWCILVQEGENFDDELLERGFTRAATFRTDRDRYHELWVQPRENEL